MDPIILDGKAYADYVCNRLYEEVSIEVNGSKREPPTLMIISTGYDKASMAYLNNKLQRCIEIGINVTHKHFNVLKKTDIESLCGRNYPTIFQMPIVCECFCNPRLELLKCMTDSQSDVDGFISASNIAALYSTGVVVPSHVPCTPKGIINLLKHHDIQLEGKTACVIGRSDIVGRPVARMLERENATVIQCHSKTPREVLRKMIDISDIIVSAVGTANFITEYDLIDHVQRGTRIVITDKVFVDVGINRDENGKMCGDIPERLKQKAHAYTPVPGGIGPVTVAMLMYNTVQAWKKIHGLAPMTWS